ncbi:MAG: S41 family peptidase [Proteobacteria bacterium]|nr:S41 family peptidase [Pseudomonadota bacterium]
MSKRASEENVTGPGPLTVGVLLIGLLLAISGTAPGRRFIEMLEGIKPLKSLSGALLRTEPVSDDKTSGALLDAVIAIVQSYYVDSDRTEAKVLLKGAVQDLAFAIPEVELIESDQMQTLKVKGKGLAISLNQDLSYDELLAHLKSLVKLCSAVHLETMVSLSSSAILGSEPNCSTMILNAVLSSLDAHSSLMSPDSYKDLRQGTDGSFGGLGVIVGVKNHQLTVIKPMPRSPALRAGLKKNDHIISIDGFSTFGLSLDQLVAHMKGDPGSIAQLSVLRPDSQFPISLPVRREIIEVDSVEARPHHKGQIHFLQLVVDSFSARTGKEVLAAIKLFRSKFPLHGVVLDLRSNPGGLLDQAIEVSDIFLKSGIIAPPPPPRARWSQCRRG